MNQRNPRSITRLRILAEAHMMLLTAGMPEAIGVRLADALARLGLTTGAAYNIWDSQTRFREDLTLHMASHQSPPTSEGEPSVSSLIEDSDLDETDAVKVLLAHCVRRLETAPDHALNYYLATIREPSAELVAAIETAQQQSLAHTAAVVKVWMDHFERQPVAPITVETLAVMARDAAEGIFLRKQFQPDAVDLDGDALPVKALAAALVSLSEPR